MDALTNEQTKKLKRELLACTTGMTYWKARHVECKKAGGADTLGTAKNAAANYKEYGLKKQAIDKVLAILDIEL